MRFITWGVKIVTSDINFFEVQLKLFQPNMFLFRPVFLRFRDFFANYLVEVSPTTLTSSGTKRCGQNKLELDSVWLHSILFDWFVNQMDTELTVWLCSIAELNRK